MRYVCAAYCFLLLLWHLTSSVYAGQHNIIERVIRYIP